MNFFLKSLGELDHLVLVGFFFSSSYFYSTLIGDRKSVV